MSIIMDNPNPIDLFSLDPGPTQTEGSQPDPVTDDAEVFDTLTTRQSRTQVDRPPHDPVGQVRVNLGIPVATLRASSNECASTCNT